MDRFAQFAVIAAREALKDSGLKITPEVAGKTAVITGSCVGGQSSQDAGFVSVYQKGLNRVHPLTIPRTMANAGASHISMQFGISGPAYTVSTACSSANHAMGQAFWMVRSGQAEIAITGGTGFIGRYILRQLAKGGHSLRCWYRPFSDRSGLDDVNPSIEWLPGDLNDEHASRQVK